ncbi:hypothetical protein [Jannaschia pohangensis]|uniref:Uncharacterized protein n=1 Tax=Jannaschia pohangensis TaxID=390807 RepID=A0A1I3SCI9_9RHOB|nr:hypothetical protein [Jannaschia pohangensis]SFJ56445.1 hypothetical protein SAMN04488095_3102 [Jannaschia pohangensis]
MPPILINLLQRPLHLLALLAVIVAAYVVLTHRPGPPQDRMAEKRHARRPSSIYA